MVDKKHLDYWLNNKNEFRKEIAKCKSNNDLYELLTDIANIGGYKLFSDNRYEIPFESIMIYNDGRIYLQFYQQGGRTYKTINGMSKKVELIKCSTYDSFSVWKE